MSGENILKYLQRILGGTTFSPGLASTRQALAMADRAREAGRRFLAKVMNGFGLW
jgi:hypothetical protein